RALLGETDDVRIEQLLLTSAMGEASDFAESLLWTQAHENAARREAILEALTQGALATGRLHHARQALDEWLSQPTTDGRPYYWRGIVLEQFGGPQEDQAVRDFEQAVRLDPDTDDYRFRLGELLLKRSRAADAVGPFEELHRRRADNVDAAVGLARCRFALGDLDAAGRLLDEALARDP